jgi:hypothetical protein
MGRKVHNIHYIYKTICNVTGKYYVGMHSTSNEDDKYLGSGLRLRYSIRKYGVDNHSKEILEYCNSREELVLREKEIVNSDLIQDKMCMNLIEGGYCGNGRTFTDEERKKGILASQAKLKLLRETDPDWVKRRGDKISKTRKEEYDKGIREKGIFCDWTGKNHSEESKKLISESKKDKFIGENSSQYGTCWINKEGINKKIKKELIDEYLLDGWIKGRIYNRWK